MVIKPKKVGELAVIILTVKVLSHLVKYLVLYINVNCGPKLTNNLCVPVMLECHKLQEVKNQ
jgi:hypothetical protein